jgi:hypothetical protein
MNSRHLLLVAALCAPAATFAEPATKPDPKALSAALASFLSQQGDFCLGKFDWPINVSEQDIRFGTRNAVQMPVLEKMGLVASSKGMATRTQDKVEETVAVTRYALTDAGKAFYLQREAAGDDAHRHDLCAGHLSLDKLVRWSDPVEQGDHQELTVAYTYHFTGPKWSLDPEVQKVFPVLALVVHGEGSRQLNQRLQLKNGQWVAVNAVESARP